MSAVPRFPLCREAPLELARIGGVLVGSTPLAAPNPEDCQEEITTFLAWRTPRFLPGSPSHRNSNRWQIVEEAFFDILDLG
jgi:hypothetical protein